MAKASRLSAVKRGVIPQAHRYVFYGPEAVGKTTLAAHAPNPIFLDIEDGTSQLDVARYPFRDGPDGHVAKSLDEVTSAISDLGESDHDFRSMVIDTLDALEPLVWSHVCARDGKKGIEDYGYGKGYTAALAQWRELLDVLDRLRTSRAINIILLAHTQVKTFKNPDGEDWDRYQLRLHQSDRVPTSSKIMEWADVVGFCCYEEGAGSMDGSKAKGYSTGRRLIKLQRTATNDAKSRIPLPEQVELSIDDPWSEFSAAVAAGEVVDPAKILESIKVELDRIGSRELTSQVRAAVQLPNAKKNAATLQRYLQKLKTRPVAQQEG